MEIMYIERKPVLLIVDGATHFSSACFLTTISTESIWDAILTCWASIHTGLLNTIVTAQGSQFREKSIDIAAMNDAKIQRTGIEAHSSLGIGERYHSPLRNMYTRLKSDNPKATLSLLLRKAVEAMNDTLGPEGIVPSALVFLGIPEYTSFLWTT